MTPFILLLGVDAFVSDSTRNSMDAIRYKLAVVCGLGWLACIALCRLILI
nr:MAG TPA: hypothetical protein [Caudoviricetes sp.]